MSGGGRVEAGIGRVVVATDDEGIAAAIRAAGGEAVMTGPDHLNGTSRINEALARLDPDGAFDTIVNVQGDLPTVAPASIRAALDPLADPAVDIATIAAEIVREEERTNPAVVKVVGTPVAARRLRALYFTRATAPWGDGPLYHHIGLYAYRRAALARYVALPPSPLGNTREAGAAPGARGRHADRRRDRRCGPARCRHARRPRPGAGVARGEARLIALPFPLRAC